MPKFVKTKPGQKFRYSIIQFITRKVDHFLEMLSIFNIDDEIFDKCFFVQYVGVKQITHICDIEFDLFCPCLQF